VADRLGGSRRRATGMAALAVTLLGLLPALDNRCIDILYSLFGEAALLFGGLMMALLLGWLHPSLGIHELCLGFVDRVAADGVGQASRHAWPVLWWMRMLRFVAVPMLRKSLLHLPIVFRPLLGPWHRPGSGWGGDWGRLDLI